jgi:hypothetical protein
VAKREVLADRAIHRDANDVCSGHSKRVEQADGICDELRLAIVGMAGDGRDRLAGCHAGRTGSRSGRRPRGARRTRPPTSPWSSPLPRSGAARGLLGTPNVCEHRSTPFTRSMRGGESADSGVRLTPTERGPSPARLTRILCDITPLRLVCSWIGSRGDAGTHRSGRTSVSPMNETRSRSAFEVEHSRTRQP